MGGTVSVLTSQIVSMFLIMAVGFLVARTGMIDRSGTSQLSDLVLYVANPATIVTSFMRPFDAAEFYEDAWCFVISLLLLAAMALLAWVAYHGGRRLDQASVFASNCGFIGIPLVQSTLGTDYVFYLSMAIAAFNLFVWTYGIWLVSGDPGQVTVRKFVTCPALVAVAVGLLIYVCQIQLPDVLSTSLSAISDLNTGLAMVVLGAMLGQADLRSLLRERSLYGTSLMRLVVAPLVVLAILMAFRFLPSKVLLVLLIAYSAPAAVMIAMFAEKFDGDYRHAAGVVALSTLLSVVTMPVLLALGLALL